MPFPPTALRRHHAQSVRDSTSSYKIDYIIVINNFLNPKGHPNPIRGSRNARVAVKMLHGISERIYIQNVIMQGGVFGFGSLQCQ